MAIPVQFMLFDFFERLDEATDITLFIDDLAFLGRQVFIGVLTNYSINRSSIKVQFI